MAADLTGEDNHPASSAFTLRRTLGTNLLRAGTDIVVVAQLRGPGVSPWWRGLAGGVEFSVPAVTGVLIATTGVGVCFLANAGSFAAVLVALARIRTQELHPAPPAGRERGQLRQGLRYVRGTPGLLVPLLMMALVGTFAYEFQVALPLLTSAANRWMCCPLPSCGQQADRLSRPRRGRRDCAWQSSGRLVSRNAASAPCRRSDELIAGPVGPYRVIERPEERLPCFL